MRWYLGIRQPTPFVTKAIWLQALLHLELWSSISWSIASKDWVRRRLLNFCGFKEKPHSLLPAVLRSTIVAIGLHSTGLIWIETGRHKACECCLLKSIAISFKRQRRQAWSSRDHIQIAYIDVRQHQHTTCRIQPPSGHRTGRAGHTSP